MKKVLFVAMMLVSLGASAQETYENANLMTEDLSGTARYVGMGGAMEALGADISTMGTNPAGIGLFRRSQANISIGIISQHNAAPSTYTDATKWSFDQAGFVWSTRVGANDFLNLGFNYKKSRNFANILTVADRLSNASQNKLTAAKGYEGILGVDNCYTQVDYLNENVLGLYDEVDGWGFFNANQYSFQKETEGYMAEYDFNVSGNVSDNVYLGLTLGVKDIDYTAYTKYNESLLNYENAPIGDVSAVDTRYIDGTGFDVKFGVIFFPIDESPLRIGASIATPTWYDLTTQNSTGLYNNTSNEYGAYDNGSNSESYDFRMFTPWKFGLSVGHTIDNKLALGASYEYAGYNCARTRIIDGHNGYGDPVSSNDMVMNNHTKNALKGVSTLKLGAEYKLTPELAFRAGYNFVSAMYNMDAFRDSSLDSPGSYYSSTTDYTNWKATNRLTLGMGYSKGHVAIDLAYQYAVTKGEFAPFMSYYGEYEADDCVADVANVKNERSQVMATFTYKF